MGGYRPDEKVSKLFFFILISHL